jgi:hypothetical protein
MEINNMGQSTWYKERGRERSVMQNVMKVLHPVSSPTVMTIETFAFDGFKSPWSREPHLRQFLPTINARVSVRDEITDTGRNNDFPPCGHA